MDKKFLPIGSVCTVKGQTKKIMITGYYSVEYNGNIKIKDYSGCFYPEGMLLPNSVISFNHSEIDKVDFLGFKNEENEIFQTNLNKIAGVDSVASTDQVYSKMIFDENGVVTLAESVDNKIDDVVEEEKPVIHEEISNPFYKEYTDSVYKPRKNDLDIQRIQFDENGVVISVSDIDDAEKEQALNAIETARKSEPNIINQQTSIPVEKTTLDTIEFDENGNIVGV